MSDPLSKIIIGNVAIRAASLREYLKKSHYWLTYDPDRETITLNANHNAGGEVLLEIRQASYENAERLARELGLKADGRTTWHKWNPVYELDHDGSAEAEALRMKMLALGLPHKVYRNRRQWALLLHQGSHTPPMWTVDVLLKMLEEEAERYKDQLETVP